MLLWDCGTHLSSTLKIAQDKIALPTKKVAALSRLAEKF